nr:hypothetical protein GCM10017611_02420 [Rhodococcus wratislaviensis]
MRDSIDYVLTIIEYQQHVSRPREINECLLQRELRRFTQPYRVHHDVYEKRPFR